MKLNISLFFYIQCGEIFIILVKLMHRTRILSEIIFLSLQKHEIPDYWKWNCYQTPES